MIYIKKYFDETDRKALYDSLADKNQGKKEEKKPLLVHLIHHKNKHYFNSNLYGTEVIKDKLLSFFHGKCGYCEDFMGNTHVELKPDWDWQIEHYRPKAKVFEDHLHTGYYWLAYECTNFLIGCPICNGLRRKGDKFPIANGVNRLTDVNFVENNSLKLDVCSLFHPIFKTEKPLLVNPVLDNPKDFFAFLPDGTMEGKDVEGRGDTSIKIYGLDRKALRLRRRKIVDNIRKSIAKEMKRLVQIKNPDVKNKKIKEEIEHHLKDLLSDIKNPESTFIAFKCAIFVQFDSFIFKNENALAYGSEPFIMPERVALLNAYMEMKQKPIH